MNRVWARLVGRGLVMPLDQMHSENPASHPELLTWLTNDLVAHGYDCGGCIAESRSVRPMPGAAAGRRGERPADELYAAARVRPLTPRQYALSLLLATSAPGSLPAESSAAEWDGRLQNLENQAAGLAQRIEYPGENFQVSVDEALLLSNSGRSKTTTFVTRPTGLSVN